MRDENIKRKVENLEKRVGIIEKFIAWWHSKHWRWFTETILKKKEERIKKRE